MAGAGAAYVVDSCRRRALALLSPLGRAFAGPDVRAAGEDAGAEAEAALAHAEESAGDGTEAYEFCSRVIWSDSGDGFTTDLEDGEAIEAFVGSGWELVHVIVPFAATNQLALAYPGNTRKLVGYFRRHRKEEGLQ